MSNWLKEASFWMSVFVRRFHFVRETITDD